MPDDREKASEGEYLAEIALYPRPVVKAGILAERLGVSGSAVNARLKTLETNEYVESWSVGASARVWWLTDAGRDRLDELRQSGSQ